MEKALSLAAKGRGYVEPNPMVGAVIVKDGGIIAEGCHARFGGPHAEVAALQDARRRGMETSGATLYLTLEPCAHYGKTPPCAPALVEAGLKRVVMATLDPLWVQHASRAAGRPAGRGMELLLEAGISVETGLCQDEAVLLNAGFFKLARTALPLVIAKWAMSADGKIATRTGSSRWISCADSRRLVHELRGMVDAILVGSSTVERDDPLLTCREAEPRRIATRVALCGSKAPSAQAQLVRTARLAPTILAFAEGHEPPGLAALKGEGCELLPLPASQHGGEGVDLRSLLASLAKRGASNVLVEGGREVLGSFFDDGLIDRVMIFIAPFIIGGREAVGAVGGRGVENIKNAVPFAGRSIVLCQEENSLPALRTTVRQVGRDLLVEGWISNPLEWLP
jgi:diaminohydroxyphosphoribosylaminopyrimidine deaminase/5-amino-6-(5-phosphoribosylamino)uracil reductase